MKSDLKVVFMGTPEFSIPTLEALNENFEVISVITQPDRKKNRGKKVTFTPVKTAALEMGLHIECFENINSSEAKEYLKSLEIDFIIVVAYGQILKKWLIDLPKYSILNVHASLLPKYRGAAPIQRAIIEGEKVTGITIMEIDEGLDTGDMLGKVEIEIGNMDYGQLHDALKNLGTDILIDSMHKIKSSIAIPIRQNPELSSYAAMIKKSETQIDWNENSNLIYNKIRGFSPNPAAFSYYGGKRIKIYKIKIVDLNLEDKFESGQIVAINQDEVIVKTADGYIAILELQAENSKRMDISTYLRGNKFEVGEVWEKQ